MKLTAEHVRNVFEIELGALVGSKAISTQKIPSPVEVGGSVSMAFTTLLLSCANAFVMIAGMCREKFIRKLMANLPQTPAPATNEEMKEYRRQVIQLANVFYPAPNAGPECATINYVELARVLLPSVGDTLGETARGYALKILGEFGLSWQYNDTNDNLTIDLTDPIGVAVGPKLILSYSQNSHYIRRSFQGRLDTGRSGAPYDEVIDCLGLNGVQTRAILMSEKNAQLLRPKKPEDSILNRVGQQMTEDLIADYDLDFSAVEGFLSPENSVIGMDLLFNAAGGPLTDYTLKFILWNWEHRREGEKEVYQLQLAYNPLGPRDYYPKHDSACIFLDWDETHLRPSAVAASYDELLKFREMLDSMAPFNGVDRGSEEKLSTLVRAGLLKPDFSDIWGTNRG